VKNDIITPIDEIKLKKFGEIINEIAVKTIDKSLDSATDFNLELAGENVKDMRFSDSHLESSELLYKIKNPYEEYLGWESDDEKKLDYIKTIKDPVSLEEFKYREVKWLEIEETDYSLKENLLR
jgi:hypothetical protein